MSNFFVPTKDRTHVSRAAASLEDFNPTLISTEDWASLFKDFVLKVKIAFGKQEAMATRIDDNKDKFENLFKDIYVRTVMPADLEKVMKSLELLTKLISDTREGDLIKFSDQDKAVLAESGIVVREDGDLHAANFKSGNWGEGKDKDGIKGPMTFKKKIGEFKWEEYAPGIADRFVEAVRKVDSNRVSASLNHHYKDHANAVSSAQQKGEVAEDKHVAFNQARNMLVIRYQLIKFVYSQLATLLTFAHEHDDGSAKAKDPNEKYHA